jgi:hypothetical protein
MRTNYTFVTFLFAATLITLVPATAATETGPNDAYAQATPADQAMTKKQKSKRKPTSKAEYMRAVPSR